MLTKTTLSATASFVLLVVFGNASKTADACGFLAGRAGADVKPAENANKATQVALINDAIQVVLMRDGARTVLSLQNDYRGPPEDFALVVPVPVVLQKENVKTLSADVFKRIEMLSAPRLVEYWEQDPCNIDPDTVGTRGHGAGTGTGQGFGTGHGTSGVERHPVTVEAQFEVGEYEIVILSAKESSGLEAWLRDNKYNLPPNAEPALKPYVEQGFKFFVAKVNVAKVKLENGRANEANAKRATLSPLRFHYDSEKFELPIKLGLLNSGGTQDLLVHILATDRYEVASYPNVTIPTNLDVTEAARASFGSFYAALFDHTLQKYPNAVVTEYAWHATTCDPCPGDMSGLSGSDLVSLGADVLPNVSVSAFRVRERQTPLRSVPSIRQGATTVSSGLPPEVIQRIVRQNFGRFRLCYDNGLRSNPKLSGRVTVKFVIDSSGAVSSAVDGGSEMPDPSVISCVVRGFGNLSFPEPEGKHKVSVSYPLIFSPADSATLPVAIPSAATSTSALASASASAAPAPPPVLDVMVSAPNTSYGLVLTRLHARYGKDSLGNDLVFRVAGPIAGGREKWTDDGKIVTGASEIKGRLPSSFQGRYAIRHAWPGKIDCPFPARNVWNRRPLLADGGAPPTGDRDAADAGAPTASAIATKLAYVERNADLASFTNIHAAALNDTMSTAPDAGSSSSKSPSSSSSRCGCRVVGEKEGDPARTEFGAFGALLLGMLASARRYRAKSLIANR